MKENSEKQTRNVGREKKLKGCKRRNKVSNKILLKDHISLVSCCKRKSRSIKLPKVFFRRSMDLVFKNLFRVLPHSSENPGTSIEFGESFYIKPKNYHCNNLCFEDPSWRRLELAYKLLSLMLKSLDSVRLVSRCLKPAYILKLLDVFQSEDARERNDLCLVFQDMYQKLHAHRVFIRKSVFNVLYSCENEKHNGIRELLILVRSMFVVEEEEGNSGFLEEFKIFLVRGLIPLYKSDLLALFYLHLNSCIDRFVENDPKLAGSVIKGMLKHWPIASSSREYFFLDGVERVLLETKPDDFRSYMVPLFHRIASCLSSPHFKVAEKGLSFFHNEGKILNLIKRNIDVISPVVIADLETKAINHWRPETKKSAHEVLSSLLHWQ